MLKGLLRVLFNGKNLLYTNLGISVSLSGLGDVLTQELESGKSNQNRYVCNRASKRLFEIVLHTLSMVNNGMVYTGRP